MKTKEIMETVYASTNLMKTAVKVSEEVSGHAKTKEVMKRINNNSELQNENKSSGSKYKGNMRDVPNVIVQYGYKRTASTLQFQILCLMMIMLHQNETNTVGCFFHRGPFKKYRVIKTHNIHRLLTSLPSNSWVFLTINSSMSSQLQEDLRLDKLKIENATLIIRYTVDVDMVSKQGHFIAYEYQSIFGVSNEQMIHIIEYLRYWDILRLCCGIEMSSDWRNRLSPLKSYKHHHDPHSVAYPACETYNIGQVEKLFINSYVYQKFRRIASLRNTIGKPSMLDGTLDGHYCERCNKNISKHHLRQMHDKCV